MNSQHRIVGNSFVMLHFTCSEPHSTYRTAPSSLGSKTFKKILKIESSRLEASVGHRIQGDVYRLALWETTLIYSRVIARACVGVSRNWKNLLPNQRSRPVLYFEFVKQASRKERERVESWNIRSNSCKSQQLVCDKKCGY